LKPPPDRGDFVKGVVGTEFKRASGSLDVAYLGYLLSKLDPDAQRVLAFAEEEAGRLGHPRVRAIHILLGLLRDENHPVARYLREQGLVLERLREQTKDGAWGAPTD
jgi:hypothetical protein